ncbi:PQQ-binding-like beta-propeller repeat protein [Lacipirellula sp.]|uniref:outer membrane protein assembly factor BamB family protein n=1 Tax=Lacipirellula sp. TaxID=2691419 RepID=UPI003D13BF58
MSSWRIGRTARHCLAAAWSLQLAFGLPGVFWGEGPETASAQEIIRRARTVFGRNAPDEAMVGVQPPTDRTLSRGMQRAQESIAGGEYSQAIRFLDEILGRDEDFFVELGEAGEYSGMKQAARRLIRDLPPEGRQSYENSYGAEAQRQLEAAIASGDSAALAKISQRYLFTPAGYEAALLLAMDEADAGRHFSAALAYEQLLEAPEAARRFEPSLSIRAASSWLAAGEEEKARKILENLLAHGEQSIEIAGRTRKFDSQAAAIEWLREVVGEPAGMVAQQERQWLTYRGNAARNGSVNGGLPHLRVRWEVRLLGPPRLETIFENLIAEFIRTEQPMPVAGNVIAAGDYIVTRTPQGVLAVDFRTGKLVWRSQPQREKTLDDLIQSSLNGDEQSGSPEPLRAFARRVWEDYLYGVVSSDGDRIYAVNNLNMPAALQYDMSPMMGGDIPADRIATNRLTAYDLATQGKLLWEIDGQQADGDLAGTFFLGAPLAVGQSLYVLGEAKSAVYLIALNRETGAVEWQQQLASLEASVQLDLRRRLQSLSPSYEGGILVCPTGSGVVMGIDLAKRSFAWAYRFDAQSTIPNMYQGGRDDGNPFNAANRWTDNAVAIADGKVVLTPPESTSLHCVELQSGKLLWKAKRDDMKRLACIEEGRVLLIGNRKAKALTLSDGKPAWKKETLGFASGAFPAGTGFVSDGKYFLPLTSAEVIAIDLAGGRVVARTAPADGAPLGNLICHRGSVISQNGKYLDCYDQIDVLRKRSVRTLQENPSDVEALRTLGEVAFNEGRLGDAIRMLEQAYRAAPDELETREVLAECLAEALDADFAGNREKLLLLQELKDGGVARQMATLRIEAKGMLEVGEPLISADACLKLYRLSGPADELMPVSRDHQTTAARWVQAQLAAIWEAANDEQRATLKSRIDNELASLGAEPRGEPLERTLAFFGNLPMTESLRLLCARELALAGQSLEAQQMFLDLVDSEDLRIHREAVGRIAWQLHEAGLHSLATAYDAELAGPLADEICFDEFTGNALVARWKDATPVDPNTWPHGRVTVAEAQTTPSMGARMRMPTVGIRMERTDSILGYSSPQFSQRGGEVLLTDNYGQEFFRTNLEAENQGMYRYNPGNYYGVSRGNLLVVSFGTQLAAFNTLSATDALAPSVMWRTSIVTNLNYDQPFPQSSSGGDTARPGSNRAPRAADADGKLIGVIGPVTSRGVIFQDQRRLVCLDPTSGNVRWSRTDVPRGCELFGDDDYLFAIPPGKTEARVYSTVDGRQLGKRAVPPFREQVVSIGRKLLRWKTAGAQATLSSVDAWSGETEWSREFGSGAAIDVDQSRYVSIVDGKGRVVILDGTNGETLVDYQTPDALRADELHLRVGQDDFLLLVRGPASMNRGPTMQGFTPDSPVIDGVAMLFSRHSGEMRWNRPAEIEQQAYTSNQPVDLPFILFSGRLTREGNTGQQTAMLVLDKATGRAIMRRDDLPMNNGGMVLARISDAAQHQAVIETAGKTFLLQFTDQRRPPEPPSLAEVESERKTSGGGLMGILFKFGRE